MIDSLTILFGCGLVLFVAVRSLMLEADDAKSAQQVFDFDVDRRTTGSDKFSAGDE